MARLVRVLAGMILGHQFQGSQGQRAGLLFPQQVNGIDGQLPGGIAAGQVEQAVLSGRGHRHQGREKGAKRLA